VGQEGFCRIIHAASIHEEELEKALALEKEASARHLREGFKGADEASEYVIKELKQWCESNALHLSPYPPHPHLVQGGDGGGKAKRNEPCPCKSGKKYKKCHGM
ncbi:MAG: SEC-C metal-binding domain-containing protein, partial [Deltaproteobacteria bacterium]